MTKSAMTKRIWLVYSILAIAVIAYTAISNRAHAADAGALTLAPTKGVSLDIGNKRAVAYFRPVTGICNVTVVLADTIGTEGPLPQAGARVTVPVLPGKNARIDTAAGKTLDLGCALGAKTVTLRNMDRVAWSRPQL